MKIDFSKNAFCITISERRYELFKHIFKSFSLPLPIRFDGYRIDEDPALGCSLSHYNLIQMAKAEKLQYLIVMEDDIFPRKDIVEHLNKALSDVPDGFDWLKLEDNYFTKFKKNFDYNDIWFEGINKRTGSGTGCYVISENAYDIALEIYENPVNEDFGKQMTKADLVMPFSQILRNCNSYALKKLAFLQHHILSDEAIISQTQFDEGSIKGLLTRYNEDASNFEIEAFIKNNKDFLDQLV